MIFKMVILLLIKIAVWATSWLPDHTPIEFPSLGPLWATFNGLESVGQFVDLTSFFLVFGLILIFDGASFIYAGYRAILGLVPAAK